LAIPWQTIASEQTADGELQLRVRGPGDYLITIAGRVLMNSRANRSELALAELACKALCDRPKPRVLLGGLGMGCTLRAALDALPQEAEVQICEINAVMLQWCRGELAELNGQALDDDRVRVAIENIADRIRQQADGRDQPRLDAIVLDLYEGPHAKTDGKHDPFYGEIALRRTHRALAPGGVFAIWSEAPDERFEARLRHLGFEVECVRPGRGGLRHAVVLGTRQ
jgi:spermidine synthase